MAAFWWVSPTSDKELGNMELCVLPTANGMKLPVLKNTKQIPPFTRLWKWQESTHVPTSSSFRADKPESPEAQPAKARKKS